MRLANLALLAAAVGLTAPAARADVKLHPIFSDNMVIQRDAAVPVWGTAEPGEPVEVKAEWKTTNGGLVSAGAAVATATADNDGKWKVTLPAFKTPGGGYTLTAKGKGAAVALKNVLVGDVWLCSGQSNMEWKLNQLGKEDQGKKVAAAAENPNIRLFSVPNRPSAVPESTFPVTATEGKWVECKPETVINFSAVGYFFGRDVQKAQNVPVGLVASDWGGTSAQSWTSREALTAEPELAYYVEQFDTSLKNYNPEAAKAAHEKAKAAHEKVLAKYKEDAAKLKAEGKPVPPAPRAPQMAGKPGTGPTTTTLFNGMINPIVGFPIKGAIWYQGESNAGKAAEYRTLMPALIKDWRTRWGAEFPFLMVQLAPFRADGSEKVSYAELRDAQTNTTKVLPKVAIAVITDVGDETDIHPQRKEPVGQRLALAARALAYSESVDYQGPTFKALKVEGDKAVVTFDHAEGGIVVKGDAPVGFAIAGEDKVFHPAKAEVKGDTVVVSSDKVSKPWAVRYGWVNFAKPELNVFDKSGLPAVPFRTDDLPLTTATPAPKAAPAKKAS